MTCSSCDDKGIIKLNWADAPEDFAICLCASGLRWRVNTNDKRKTNPMWHLWCAIQSIPVDRVVMIEDVLDADGLAERGLVLPKVNFSREAALLAASRKGKR